MIAIRGASSTIAQELCKLLPPEEEILRCPRNNAVDLKADKYLFTQGVMNTFNLTFQESDNIRESFRINTWDIMDCCERILDGNAHARICIIGSESGISGSGDLIYAASKAGLHKYIETRKVGPTQQLIGIAPSIVEDSGMTERRTDKDNLNRKRTEHPKGRFLTAIEVARLIHFCLYIDEGYLTNVVIRMNGGRHTCLR